jgi:hypothetical protein
MNIRLSEGILIVRYIIKAITQLGLKRSQLVFHQAKPRYPQITFYIDEIAENTDQFNHALALRASHQPQLMQRAILGSLRKRDALIAVTHHNYALF